LHALGLDKRPLEPAMLPVLGDTKSVPAGYRLAGGQVIRVDLAEKILRRAFDARGKATNQLGEKGAKPRNVHFRLDLALPVSIGLEEENARRLLGSAGFRLQRARALPEGSYGPEAPDTWTWRPKRASESSKRSGRDRDHGSRRHGGKRNTKPRHSSEKSGNVPKGKQPSRQKPERRKSSDTGPARAGGAFDVLADLLGK
ncbi:MAG: helicase, partial [Pseudomonadota bacterium]